MRPNQILFFCLAIAIANTSCKKLVEVQEPVKSITTTETFSTIATSNAAILAIYSDMSYGKNTVSFANGLITIDAGMSADELIPFGASGTNSYVTNKLLSTEPGINNVLWTPAYFDIYMANAAIEGLQKSTSLPSGFKDTLTGEAKFLRAFCYFYLVNLFGDVPLLTATDFASNSIAPRTPVNDVYQQIIADLKEAQRILPSDYSYANGERVRATRWAAISLLARAYLYTGKPDSAEAQATLVINNSTYSLTTLGGAFQKNNSEAILQLQSPPTGVSAFTTREGNVFIPNYPNPINIHKLSPTYYLTNQLLAAFESGDQRKVVWIDTTRFNNTRYYYPYKYKTRTATSSSGTEYYTLLRLAEQYLIRAEARAMRNDLAGAIADLNIIRTRAGLPSLSSLLTQAQVLAAVAQENRIEFFAEWGHRWFDLKRTGQADAVLGPIKGLNWQTTDQLYPIPLSEINYDHNLTQNPGY